LKTADQVGGLDEKDNVKVVRFVQAIDEHFKLIRPNGFL
jgi:hypothetical protein